MNLSDLNNLDPNNLGSAPLVLRVILIAFAVAAILGIGFYFDTSDRITQWEKVKAEEQKKKEEYNKLYQQAANLPEYEKQLDELKKSFSNMLRQLPQKAEVDALLADISQTGVAAGLEFELFKPGAPSSQDSFQFLPIQIVVTGSYHQFGQFVSGVAALSRIVTLHNVTLKGISDKKGKLRMDSVARIYHSSE